MIALRKYESGDSHRLVHWKASARTGRLLVRQFAAQSSEMCSIWLRTDAQVWSRPEQFELLLSFAATLAQDLFHAGRLQSAAIDSAPPIAVRRVSDLESFLDQLSEANPVPEAPGAPGPGALQGRRLHNVLTFEPEGTRGVASYVNGIKTAST
jgi:uncharacterized protein (DUF58 family)